MPTSGVLEVVPLAVAVFDRAMHLVDANLRYRTLTGLTLEDARGRLIVDAFPNALADIATLVSAVAHDGRAATRVVTFRTTDGERTVELTVSRSADAESWLVSCLDVTEREELRRGLARSVDELEAIFATIPEEVRVFGVDGAIIRRNPTARDAHSGDAPSTVRALWHADHPRSTDGQAMFMHEHPAARALAGESVRDAQVVVRRHGRDVTLEVNAEPLREEDGTLRGAVTIGRDVSERAALARALAEQVVAREERLAAVGRLAAGVLHDVNNVLNPILAAAYLADQFAEDAAAVREYTQRITMAAEMGVSTLARLRRFIRQEPYDEKQEELVDLGAVLDEVVSLAEPTWSGRAAERAVRVRRELAANVQVRGIAGELREAALNLIQNAVDAMPDGGALTVLVEHGGEEGVVIVRDTGGGMSDEVRNRAFEPFFSTKGSRGTGLGLAEVYGIVKRHRGVIELDTTLGEGTSVILRIPLSVAR